MLNRMCNNCLCLGENCKGETDHTYTGCIFKKQTTQDCCENNSYSIGFSREELEEKNICVSKLQEETKTK